MPDGTLSYQILMNAVFAATSARGSVYPSDYIYVALPLDTVKSIVGAFDSETCSARTGNSHIQARRLWYTFKEHTPNCACGIVRLMAPVPNDLVGIVTCEDILGLDVEIINSKSLLDREMLSDDLSEFQGVSEQCQPRQLFGDKRPTRVNPPWKPKENQDMQQRVEMTLIDPQTQEIFKRSKGGVFGEGRYPVSDVRAFAVWF
jgi:hypothetical protein